MPIAGFELWNCVFSKSVSMYCEMDNELSLETLLFLLNEQAIKALVTADKPLYLTMHLLAYITYAECHVTSCMSNPAGKFPLRCMQIQAEHSACVFVSWKQQRGTPQSACRQPCKSRVRNFTQPQLIRSWRVSRTARTAYGVQNGDWDG